LGDGPVRSKSLSRVQAERVAEEMGAAFITSSTAMCVVDPEGRIMSVNDSMCRLLRRARDDLLDSKWMAFTHLDDATTASVLMQQTLSRRNRAYQVEKRVMRQNGVQLRCRETGAAITVGGRDVLLIEILDLTDEHLLAQRATSAEERMKLATEAVQDAFVGMDVNGRITEWNEAAETMFGWSAKEAIGRELASTIVPPDQRAAHAKGLAKYLASGEGPVLNKKVEVSGLRRDGSEFLTELTIWPVATPSGVEFNAFVRDVSERRRFQEELRRLAVAATTDQGTGLKNRRGFFALAQHELNLAQRLGHPLTLIFFDLDRLKHINDTFGHIEGDRAIADTARLLSSAFRESDLVARLGGDEFCVLALGPPEAFAKTMHRFESALAEHDRTAEHPYTLSLSYGVAFFEPASGPVSLDELVSRADASMYEAKQRRRSA
jgi:diguanylate cyclase (GGDEF)-like protein/PAS domain S-box-containing protein